MLMKCSKCGYENQLNAIFCRGCGEKLTPEEVTPEELQKEAKKRKKAGRKINWKPVAGLILLALAVAYGIMLFTAPAGSPVYNKENSVPYKAELENIQDGRTTVVTPEQLTAFFNEALIDKDAAKNGYSFVLKDVVFTGKGGLLTLTIHTSILTFNATLTVTGKLKKGPEDNPVLFEMTDFKFGKTDLVPFRDKLLKHFEPVFYADSLKEIFRNATDVSVEDGKLLIVQKKKPVKNSFKKKNLKK